MQPGTQRALEFDRIVEAVTGFALTPMGRERLARLQPSIEGAAVAQALAGTTETARYVAARGTFPIHASSELPQILGALAIEGRALDAVRLIALSAFLDSIDESRAAIRNAAGSFPILEAAASGAASFKGETAQVRDKIDQAGEVVDTASPELKLIRERLRKQRTRLRTTLESYLRGKETAKYLQEQIVTERSGRYVLVVKSEHRSAIPGIVHGASTSGASLFLEPLSTVEINNEIVALEEQEAEEVRRILLALTDAFRGRAGDLQRTITAATELDVLQARARYSVSIDGVEPQITGDGAFELQAARHPLVKNAVPVTIKVIPPASVLLITGPNTGGKTVALKTAGLFALMAQAGLWVPAADGSRLPVFRSIFADIGDEQSIDANLSTFSGHITNIASMDRGLTTPSLVLLDEVGSGTDPIEGGALGVSVVDHFRRRGATVIATSHYDALKTYASTADGVMTAAFGFDPDTFAPTYHLLYGSPGRSLALEIAARLGLNPAIVAAARDNLSAREAQLAEHLAKIDRDMRALEHEQRLATRERETLSEAEARLRQREETLRQREDTFRRRLNEEVDAQVRQARREIDDVIAGLKAKAAAIANAPRLVVDRRYRRRPHRCASRRREHREARARRRHGNDRTSRAAGRAGRAGRSGSASRDAPGFGRRTRDRRWAGARSCRHRRARWDGGPRRPRQADAGQHSRSARDRRGADNCAGQRQRAAGGRRPRLVRIDRWQRTRRGSQRDRLYGWTKPSRARNASWTNRS